VGGTTFESSWAKRIEATLSELGKRFRIEAALVFGSWARSGGGEWSDIDLLIVSDDAKHIGILERFSIAAELRREKIDVFIYTYEELVNMMNKGNPLALSALIEGIPIKLSKRIEELKNKAQKMYKRVGRCWVAQLPK
jgi:predicted nucleotidyltransferase